MIRERGSTTSVPGGNLRALRFVAHTKDQARPAERAQPATYRGTSRSAAYNLRPYMVRWDSNSGSDLTPKVSIIANVAWTPTATPRKTEAKVKRRLSAGVPEFGELGSMGGVFVAPIGRDADQLLRGPDLFR
jgi:hypothetical protein